MKLPAWFPRPVKEETAGRLTFDFTGFCVHVLPYRKYWVWGMSEMWWNGQHWMFGLGPLVLVVQDEEET